MSERLAYLVCYDICDPKRLRLTYRAMRGFGQHMQYSVFRCDLNDEQLTRMYAALARIIDHREDQVMVVPLGPSGGRNATAIDTIGTPLGTPPRSVMIF